ncbi:hypothetical protein Golax_012176, partial [Gossypium laxum]|nr:hypothetical protein [Gossypium laxum]
MENIDEIKKQLALLTKSMKRFVKKGTKVDSDNTRKKDAEYYECKRFGHFQSKCANTKKKEKSLTITWNNKKSSNVDEDVNNYVAFTATVSNH